MLADPGTPGDDDAAALAALGATDSPEDDLDDALRALAAATDADAAAAARAEALAILEGTPLPGRPYSGIPLLNWNAPAKVKTVPAGGTVDVREVRFPGHSMSDAWLLRFEDPVAALHRALPRQRARRRRRRRAAARAAAGRRDGPLRRRSRHARPAHPARPRHGHVRRQPLHRSQRGLSGAPEASRLAEQVDRGAHAARPA